MKRYLTIVAIGALFGASAYADFIPGPARPMNSGVCSIKYTCGTGATGTAPTGTSIYDDSFTPVANTCTKDGYVFSHYLVTVDDYTMAQDGVAKPGVTYTIPFVGSHNCEAGLAVTLTPQWVPASGTPVVPAKSYTDAELATRQPNFTGSATDKLILFSGTTDGAFGERAVVTSLGTPNSTTGLYSGTDLSSTEVPTNGAVNTGVNRKQATVSGTANYVAMYDSNAHMTGDAKGIYNASSLTDLDTLVEAGTLNSAIVDAVNSELIQVGLDGQPSASGVLWKLNTAANLTLLGPAASGGGSGSGSGSSCPVDMSGFEVGGEYENIAWKAIDVDVEHAEYYDSGSGSYSEYGDPTGLLPGEFIKRGENGAYKKGTSICVREAYYDEERREYYYDFNEGVNSGDGEDYNCLCKFTEVSNGVDTCPVSEEWGYYGVLSDYEGQCVGICASYCATGSSWEDYRLVGDHLGE